MRNVYIGGSRSAKRGGIMWKLYLFLFFFLVATGTVLKISAPFIAERWLNNQGKGKNGYAFTVREVALDFKEGEMTLTDVKIFNPRTKVEIAQTPSMNLKMDLQDLIRSDDRRVSITSEKLDVFISPDLTAEIARISNTNPKKDWSFSVVDGKFKELNFIEKKTDESRTIVRFQDVNLEMKDLSMASVNKNTEFTLSSKLATGGEMNLTAKMNEDEGKNYWAIEGSMKEFSPHLFSKLAGNDLPFSFNEDKLNAEITARSIDGKIKGEIIPDVKKLNLIDEKPGYTRQVITRALSDELTFSLPFTLKDELTLQYAETFKKLKEYRKYPLSSVVNTRTTKLETLN